MIMFVNRDNLTKSIGWKYPYVSGPTQAFPGVFRPQPTNFRDSCRTLTYSRRSSVRLRSAGISWGASPRRLATSCGTSFQPDVPAFGTFTGPAHCGCSPEIVLERPGFRYGFRQSRGRAMRTGSRSASVPEGEGWQARWRAVDGAESVFGLTENTE